MAYTATVPERSTTPARSTSANALLAAALLEHLRRARLRLLPSLAQDAHAFVQVEAWKQFGFANAHDFSRERLDHSGRWLRNLAKLGAAFMQWPELATAVTGDDGKSPLNRAAAFEVSRVATQETIGDWIETARHTTVRHLKHLIRSHARSAADASDATRPDAHRDQPTTAQKSIIVEAPVSVARAVEGLQRVFQASDPGHTTGDFLDALNAEFLSSSPSMASAEPSPGVPTPSVPSSTEPSPAGSSVAAPSIAHPFAPGAPMSRGDGIHDAPIMMGPHTDDDIAEQSTSPAPGDVVLGLARWTLHRARLYRAASANRPERSTPSELLQSLCEAMDLERQVNDRIGQLLLWLDNRHDWVDLGFDNVLTYGEEVLGESPGTTRNRLRLARALARSATLRDAYESRGLSRQRVTRIARLAQQDKLAGDSVAEWIEHASRITIKRLDDELRVANRPRDATEPSARNGTKDCATEPSPRSGMKGRANAPRPLSDEEWFASLRFAPGDARHELLAGSLRALESRPAANVFLRLRGSAETIATFRMCLRLAHRNLTERCQVPAASPAEEARQFPSLRLARQWTAQHRQRTAQKATAPQAISNTTAISNKNTTPKTRLPDWLCLVAMLEEFAEEWDNPHRVQRRPTDPITARDGWRCTAPGCTARVLEVHHIVYQSHGGSDDASNLTSLCPFHHRMGEHGMLAQVSGVAPFGLRWRLGAEQVATSYACERPLQ